MYVSPAWTLKKKKLCILHTESFAGFCIVLKIIGNSFPKQHWLFDLYDGNMCFLWSMPWIVKYYIDKIYDSKNKGKVAYT